MTGEEMGAGLIMDQVPTQNLGFGHSSGEHQKRSFVIPCIQFFTLVKEVY